ncbi:MAG: hypothetical protein AVDCRST_MAG67-3929, partial [uncultured Solirubrobacteraceae bacterium]
ARSPARGLPVHRRRRAAARRRDHRGPALLARPARRRAADRGRGVSRHVPVRPVPAV